MFEIDQRCFGIWRYAAAAALGLLLLIAPATYGPEAETYRISAGDLLSITVYGEDDLSLQAVRVAANGSISFPLLGEIAVQGLSSRQLEEKLKQLLRDGYLRKPELTVSVVEYRLFYINGEVRNPGGYNYQDGLTIEKAVALAGGFTPRASKSKIKIVHEAQPDRPITSAPLNMEMLPGDVVTVGESFF